MCLGAAAAWYEVDVFSAWLLAACLAGVILINAGTNLANDYYDHLSGADEANPHPTPFSGGSRAIQDGTVGARAVRNAAFLCFALAAVVGGFLVWRCGWPVLVFGAIGVLSGLFYTAPPFKLGYRGLGEMLAGLNVGPLAVLGSYYVQTGTISLGVVLVSLPTGFLSSALLVMNEIPDLEPDRGAGKRHLVVWIGEKMGIGVAPVLYLLLVVSAYASLGVALALGSVPAATALMFATAPLGLRAFARARLNIGSPGKLVAAMGANVLVVVLSGALLCMGYLLGGSTAGQVGCVRLEEIFEPVAGELEAVESRLRDWTDQDPPAVSDAVNHLIRSGGKRLRPACLLLSAGLGPHGAAEGVALAAAVEIIHTASLVHDDIIDGAGVRRGVPTLNARRGDGFALLIGDLLYSRLFRQLARRGQEGALRIVAGTVHRMVLGEIEETVRRDDLTLSEAEYTEIIGNKTGALLSCACRLGARTGGLPEKDCSRPRRYGEQLGVAYQMVDDVLDICGDGDESGKPAGGDVRDGKATLPLIHALEDDRRRGFDRIRKLFLERDAGRLSLAMWQAGSVAYAVERAEAAVQEALSCLQGLQDGPCLRGLEGLGGYVALRGRQMLQRGPEALTGLVAEAR